MRSPDVTQVHLLAEIDPTTAKASRTWPCIPDRPTGLAFASLAPQGIMARCESSIGHVQLNSRLWRAVDVEDTTMLVELLHDAKKSII